MSQFRLQDERRGPWFIKFGERSVDMDVERDFNSRQEFDDYKTLNSKSVKAKAKLRGTTDDRFIEFELPSVVVDNFDVALSGGQGDLIRASTKYMALLPDTQTDGTYEIRVRTDLDLEVGASRPLNGRLDGAATAAAADVLFDVPDYMGFVQSTTRAYLAEVKHGADFDNGTAVSSGIAITGNPANGEGCEVALTGLSATTTYHVRVRVGPATAAGVWSDIFTFTTPA